ncbi:hybrid sensor histidine kinase/response regulator [Puteibacter caeruleilacunae]|nr:hybrid sensor histidine kinase/response regulator [Puteibacter caeruleilacunae]
MNRIGKVIWFIVALMIPFLVEAQEYQVNYLTIKNGLSHNEVTSIIQDDYGFMWFGTRGGLNRYDGYQFKQYKPSRSQTQGLHSPSVERLYKAGSGDIYIGTKSSGYTVYSKKLDNFLLPNPIKTLENKRIVSFFEDKDSSVWIGSWENGIYTLSQEDSVAHYFGKRRINQILQAADGTLWFAASDGLVSRKVDGKIRNYSFGFPHDEVSEMAYDEANNCLWLVGWNIGLVKFDCQTNTYQMYQLNDKVKVSSYSLLLDKTGKLWVGTWGRGLYWFDEDTKSFEKVKLSNSKSNAVNINYNIILDICQDSVGDIWIGTDGGGVVRLSKQNNFNVLKDFSSIGIKRVNVSAVFKDHQQRLWIGTKTGKLLSYKEGVVTQVRFSSNDKMKNRQLVVKKIYEDKNKVLWISFDGGLYVVKESNAGNFVLEKASTYFNSPDLNISLKVHDILVQNDELWLATQQRGLHLYNFVDGKYKKIQQFKKSLAKGSIGNNRVTSLVSTNKDNLWVATYDGLFQYQRGDSTFLSINDLLSGNRKPLSDIILCTCLDSQKNLWFGTPCSLNKLERESSGYRLVDYTKEDGFSDDYINSILTDSENNIWLSTNTGISQLDAINGEIRNYSASDGIDRAGFNEGVGCKSKHGILYFGGKSGVTYFTPSEIFENEYAPNIVITDFKILNNEVPISEDGILSNSINEQKKIILNYKQREFSFEFSALDYSAPRKNQYGYQLEGFNDSLIHIGERRHISFSNLEPGTYTLHLKGTNANGIWSDKSYTLDIEVMPAPWKTWYAKISYAILLFVIVMFISRYRLKQERLQNAVAVERMKREQQAEMNEYRLRFFTSISHELRTPLTLILAPINEILSRSSDLINSSALKSKLLIIQHNAVLLSKQINQLLEFRKLEAGKMKLEVVEVNLKEFVSKILHNFEDYALNKEIEFTQKYYGDDWDCYVDVEKMSVVMNNLLINAFKYSGAPGQVSVVLKESSNEISISVINNGPGIPSSEIGQLFERYYQVGQHQTRGTSGLGLAIVKSYVDLLHGDISVESVVNDFTTFTITIKKGKDHFVEGEIKEKGSKEPVIVESLSDNKLKTRPVYKGIKGAVVLVVEDNEEVRNYLVDLLSEFYETLEADNGQKGFDMAIEYKPAIILSDVIMPVMDGFELCDKVKSNELISHIPVILLTAKGTVKDELYGTRKGADMYLTKPFNPDLLLEKIKVLIASRTALTSKYSKKILLESQNKEITSEEAKFLKTVIDTIDKHISETDFDAEKLALEVGMSPSTFYRKSKRLANQTPGEFIKKIRMQRAAKLLEVTDLSVSEIAEEIGYVDIKSFRNTFKKTYGMNPLDYRLEKKS